MFFQQQLSNGDGDFPPSMRSSTTPTTSSSNLLLSSSVSGSSTSFADFSETLIWSLLFYPMVIMAAIENLLIIWIIATKPLMRNIMNQYLINLTLSDLLSVTFNASFNFFFMLNQHWPFGKWYCVANNFIANLTIVSSVSTMMLISIDRYYAIVHPLKPRQTKRRLLLSIGAIWTLSVIFSLPSLIYSDVEDIVPSTATNAVDFNQRQVGIDYFSISSNTTTNKKSPNKIGTKNATLFQNDSKLPISMLLDQHDSDAERRTLCIMRWPDGISGFSTYEFWYNWAFLILFYVIPVLTMVVALILMSRVLWPGESIGEHTTIRQQTLIRSKRKVVCMLICVISVFALCWLPYHCYFISIYWWPSLIRKPGIKHVYLAFYWFAMANSLFNPVILFAMNRRIRNYILNYFKCSCCVQRIFVDSAKSRKKRKQTPVYDDMPEAERAFWNLSKRHRNRAMNSSCNCDAGTKIPNKRVCFGCSHQHRFINFDASSNPTPSQYDGQSKFGTKIQRKNAFRIRHSFPTIIEDDDNGSRQSINPITV